MSSFNNYIKFALDIKDQNIVFENYFCRLVNGHKQKIYQAGLLQSFYDAWAVKDPQSIKKFILVKEDVGWQIPLTGPCLAVSLLVYC